jgi:predicted DNA-binding ribbon-helix-helix protein
MAKKQRSLILAGHKQGIYLEESEWQALDLLARGADKRWGELVTDFAALNPEQAGINLTGLVRASITRGLLSQLFLQERGSLAELPQSPLLQLSAVFSDDELKHDLLISTGLSSADMGGFQLWAGLDQFGRHCLWIENQLKGGSHVAIPLVNHSLGGNR